MHYFTFLYLKNRNKLCIKQSEETLYLILKLVKADRKFKITIEVLVSVLTISAYGIL